MKKPWKIDSETTNERERLQLVCNSASFSPCMPLNLRRTREIPSRNRSTCPCTEARRDLYFLRMYVAHSFGRLGISSMALHTSSSIILWSSIIERETRSRRHRFRGRSLSSDPGSIHCLGERGEYREELPSLPPRAQALNSTAWVGRHSRFLIWITKLTRPGFEADFIRERSI